MTDRELLEAAAKAAGVPIYESDDGTVQRRPVWVVSCGGGNGTMPYEREWNPLVDDGDALRLAVALGISVTMHRACVCTQYPQRDLPMQLIGAEAPYENTSNGQNPYAATRRAIVRAAAQIGRTM